MKKPLFISIVVLFLLLIPIISAQEACETHPDIIINPEVGSSCAVYFTGVGCPHCAKVDPLIFEKLLNENPNLAVIEYEVYQQSENAPLIYDYDEKYNTGLGIPLLIFENNILAGDKQIEKSAEQLAKETSNCLLPDQTNTLKDLDFNALPNKPKIWTKDRILIRTEGEVDNALAEHLLIGEDLAVILQDENYKTVDPKPVPLSGKNIIFENAIEVNGWTFQWNGEALESQCCCPDPSEWSECINETKTRTNYKCSEETNYECEEYEQTATCEEDSRKQFTLIKLISLAAVDAVNPCAIAVLTLILIAILTYNPKRKKRVLLAGLAFVVAVFVMYMIYGLIIIKFFQLIQALTAVRLWLLKALGIVAIGLGILNIKDYFHYRPGGFATEMPLSMRPKMKRLISSVTSPKGAFIIGLFVTVFLLPCTIGPYVIAGGILSAFELVKTIPSLLLYNLIFVLPMIAITLIIYAGVSKVQDVSGWKEKNIRWLHLIAGVIMVGLGIAMFFGWL